ncbi:BTB/POZ domain-containing protein At3g56230-like [Actinidia eriantha]|uniref:BTB/POZ domain-containing protein At3g56230-like n=1 Tax=Actinidia eriantha TaxID=165200 RepID=UPI00258F24F1|nr:BTB/POZ domain-containing protein At3g56230-like [Actinidia eriantha]
MDLRSLKLVKEMKDMEDELNEKLAFLGSFVTSFRDQIHTDIQVKPSNNGPPILAHRPLLAARSEIFKNILDSDGCKAPPNDLITILELTHEELDSVLEFLYTGTLPKEKVEKHVYSLSMAADKYDIKFLQKFCEYQMLESLNSSNALDVLEISDVCSNQGLKESVLKFIVRNMEHVVSSARFDAFALKNPHLTVQITRASLVDIKKRRYGY